MVLMVFSTSVIALLSGSLAFATSDLNLRQQVLSTNRTAPRREVGKLPALGWNTWNAYRCNISAALVLDAARDFIRLGLRDVGYQYVNIDDCWSEKNRSSSGRLIPDLERFPKGIAHVASKVHDLGLKVGIYSDAGTLTCAGYPASLGYESIDAETFADWGIDYLKYDNCNVPDDWSDQGKPPGGDWSNSKTATRYRRMSQALSLQSRPVAFSLCVWGRANVWSWGPSVGHSWRIFDDSQPTWYYIMSIMQTNIQFLDYVNFYSHNDMDMMEIGNGHLTIAEQRTHFAVWAFMKSPILLGTDLSRLSNEELAIITNHELLAFNQDEDFGTAAKPFDNAAGEIMSPPEYYAGESSLGVHVFIVNTNNLLSNKTVEFASVPGLEGERFLVYDMWTSEDLGIFLESFTVTLAAHDTGAFRLSKI